jgi:hypothetical protein
MTKSQWTRCFKKLKFKWCPEISTYLSATQAGRSGVYSTLVQHNEITFPPKCFHVTETEVHVYVSHAGQHWSIMRPITADRDVVDWLTDPNRVDIDVVKVWTAFSGLNNGTGIKAP